MRKRWVIFKTRAAKLHQMQLNLRDMSLSGHGDWYYKSVLSEFDTTVQSASYRPKYTTSNSGPKWFYNSCVVIVI